MAAVISRGCLWHVSDSQRASCLLLQVTSDGDMPITSRSDELVPREAKLFWQVVSVSTPTASVYVWLPYESAASLSCQQDTTFEETR